MDNNPPEKVKNWDGAYRNLCKAIKCTALLLELPLHRLSL